MSKIKIHELYEIGFKNVKDTDIFVLENEYDTWKIPMADLRLLFSNDSKIQSVRDELLKLITKLGENNDLSHEEINALLSDHTSKINNMIESMSNINGRVVSIENNISAIKEEISALTDRVSSTDTSITAINRILDTLDDRITALEQDNVANKDKITKIETKNTSQDNSITTINTKLVELKTLIDSYNGVSTDSLLKLEKELNATIISKYNELLLMIDEYHHQIPLLV